MLTERLFRIFVVAITFTMLGFLHAAAAEFDANAHYLKREYKIEMRDGIKLHTVVYSPKDTSRQYPILLHRTPYSAGPYGEEFETRDLRAPGEKFLEDGFIFVRQDARGTHYSEGEWVNLKPIRENENDVDESTDAYDTIEWLVNSIPNNNGRVGQWGISHPGWYTVQSIINPHPALKAASPQATTFDPFIGDDERRNGVLRLMSIEWFYTMSLKAGENRRELNGTWPKFTDFGTPWRYQFYLNAGPTDKLNQRYFGGKLSHLWDNVLENPNYNSFWEKINVGRHLNNIKIPVLHVGGWFDVPDPYGAFKTYEVIEQKNPNNKSSLVVGPWAHGGWFKSSGAKLADMEFGSNTAEYYRENILFPFFNFYLKEKGSWDPAEAIVFETGENEWHTYDSWPPKDVTKTIIYFHENNSLTFDRKMVSNRSAHDSYISDPKRPVPFSPDIAEERSGPHNVKDQRFAYSRPDVLSYETTPLDRDITIAGPIPAKLFVSTSGTDSDWYVKIIDVFPGDATPNSAGVPMAGYQMLVGMEVMRGRFRNSFYDPEPMEPNKPTPINLEIRDKFHTFKKGHKIMVQIQSSSFPLHERNPQTFTNTFTATEANFHVGTQKVYRSKKHRSHLILPVVTN
ncbi:MAG: CocE/NonD family hydrolase [Pseudomonadota bacterium]